jgi:hypothetical protein
VSAGQDTPVEAAGRPPEPRSGAEGRNSRPRPFGGLYGPHTTSTAVILVTGSRAFWDRNLINNALTTCWTEAQQAGRTDLVVVHGNARGADTLADRWTQRHNTQGVHYRRFPADWEGDCDTDCPTGHRKTRTGGGTYCPWEGRRRNQRMVDHVAGQRASGCAVLALAFFVDQLNSPGTHDCLRRIKTARLPYRVFTSARQASR